MDIDTICNSHEFSKQKYKHFVYHRHSLYNTRKYYILKLLLNLKIYLFHFVSTVHLHIQTYIYLYSIHITIHDTLKIHTYIKICKLYITQKKKNGPILILRM